jgi:hypothetical protein
MRKDRSTITDYLNHTRYLPDELLNRIVEKEAKKRFFERLAFWTRIMRLRLQEQRVAPSEIENQISQAAAQMADAFIENGDKAFSTTAKGIYGEFLPHVVRSANPPAEIPSQTEDTGERGENRDSEVNTRDGEDSHDSQVSNDETPALSNNTGQRESLIGQVISDFESICRDTAFKLASVTEVQQIHALLTQHKIEIGKIQIELLKTHAQLAGN